MAGTGDAAANRRKIQRQIAKELKAGQYRPRARKLTVQARQLASYRPQAERIVLKLGLDGTPEEDKYLKGIDDAYHKMGLLWVTNRMNAQEYDTGRYAEWQEKEPGNENWDRRNDRVADILYHYHGVVWAYL